MTFVYVYENNYAYYFLKGNIVFNLRYVILFMNKCL